MKTMLIAAAAAAMLSSPTLAADLPDQKQSTIDQQLMIAVEKDSYWYLGATSGFNYVEGQSLEHSQKSLGAVIGYQYDQNFAAEVAFSQFFEDGGSSHGQALMVNGVALVPNETVFTPYVVAGVGSGFNGLGNDGDPQAIYGIGAGIRYAVSDSVGMDLRYTRIDAWADPVPTNSVTVGITYRF